MGSWNLFWKHNKGNLFPKENLVKFLSVTESFSKKKNILDIGFGSLSNLAMSKKLGYMPHGIDIANAALKKKEGYIIKKFYPPKIPFKDKTFGVIYSCQAIYYNWNNLNSVLSELYRVLDDGGKFFIDFRTKNHTWTKTKGIKVSKNVIQWSEKMPVKFLRGLKLYQPFSEKDLRVLFKKFDNLRIDVTSNNFLGRTEEYYLVTVYKNISKKDKKNLQGNSFESYQKKL